MFWLQKLMGKRLYKQSSPLPLQSKTGGSIAETKTVTGDKNKKRHFLKSFHKK
jgi:hypothetical protein